MMNIKKFTKEAFNPINQDLVDLELKLSGQDKNNDKLSQGKKINGKKIKLDH